MTDKIEFFDCSKESDMIEAEVILTKREVVKKEVVNFPYLMVIYKE